MLHAFQEVEDQLAALRWLGKELKNRDAAELATERVLGVSLTLYREGVTNHPFLL